LAPRSAKNFLAADDGLALSLGAQTLQPMAPEPDLDRIVRDPYAAPRIRLPDHVIDRAETSPQQGGVPRGFQSDHAARPAARRCHKFLSRKVLETIGRITTRAPRGHHLVPDVKSVGVAFLRERKRNMPQRFFHCSAASRDA
jgi:hypothetical protein